MTSIVKVNGAARADFLGLLPGDVWVGCRYGAEGLAGSVNREQFLALRRIKPAAKFVLSFNEYDTPHEKRLRLLDELAPDYYEYTPPDPLKKAEFAACMERLGEIEVPKIAGPFPVLKDDMSMIREREPFAEMTRRGTVYFLFDVESAVDADFRLSTAQRRELDDFWAEFPALANDSFDRLDTYPLQNQHGYSLDAIVPGTDQSARSGNAMTSAKIVRLLKTLR
ncbi:hypothetical protein QWJ34_08690 [Saccharibacillus sp. CPCC 101409]|uniref:hypothetical protein n=1 Tax=Saccharibacillus sp. CPCC 101409 TaxID=3058041 RepID=UPI0026711F33|nr:hypothetical protein [Saccharibacillus sp. CPCC 101409]MDO3409839.1 hypothetical protein [Saccharibacillus sp. CPCC 101409]